MMVSFKRSSSLRVAGLVVGMCAPGMFLQAQTPASPANPAGAPPASVSTAPPSSTPAPSRKEPKPQRDEYREPEVLPRFSFGGRIAYNVFKTIDGGSSFTSSSTTLPRLDTTMTAVAASKPISGGLVFEVRVRPRWSLNIEAMYRRTGFDSTRQLTYTNINSAVSNTTYTQGNRMSYLDFPVLVRWYDRGLHKRYRTFFTAGVTMRRVWHVRSSSFVTTDTTQDCCDETPIRPTRQNVPGFTVGAGLKGLDDFGLKLTPEVRYTRWMYRTIDMPPAYSKRDQLEVSLSLTF